MTAGRFQLAATRDLGGLGATEGPPIAYNWTTGGLGARLLPWLVILALLALRANRGWSGWWVWLPLGALAIAYYWLRQALQGSVGNGAGAALEIFLDIPMAWGFGLAALWLLASHLDRHRLFQTFLGSLAVLAVFAVLSFASTAGWGLMAEPVASLLDPRHCAATTGAGLMAVPLLVPLALPTVVLAVALALSGLACRGRYRPFWGYVWFGLSLLGGWIGISVLLHALYHELIPGLAGYGPFLGIALVMTFLTFIVSLPFLVLSTTSSFFRERLKALLHVKPAVSTVVGVAAGPALATPSH